jgi:uncharacterized membrane protein YeiB
MSSRIEGIDVARAISFCILSMVFSNIRLKYFKLGPFEMIFKKAVS